MTAAFAEASGERRSWLTARKQRGPQLVRLGQRLGLGRGLPQPATVEQRGSVGGERPDQPALVGGEVPALQHQHQAVPGRDLGVALVRALAGRRTGRGDPAPAARHLASAGPSSGAGSTRSISTAAVIPNDSRTRSSSAGSAVSPRSTLPARVASVSDSAAARAACRVRRAARSTTELTSAATSTKTTSASALFGSAMLKV